MYHILASTLLIASKACQRELASVTDIAAVAAISNLLPLPLGFAASAPSLILQQQQA